MLPTSIGFLVNRLVLRSVDDLVAADVEQGAVGLGARRQVPRHAGAAVALPKLVSLDVVALGDEGGVLGSYGRAVSEIGAALRPGAVHPTRAPVNAVEGDLPGRSRRESHGGDAGRDNSGDLHFDRERF